MAEIAEASQKAKFADSDQRRAMVGPDTLSLWREIDAQGLQTYIAELDVKGFTVIPPEAAGTVTLWPRILDAILDVAERRSGSRPVLDENENRNMHGSLGSLYSYLLFEAPAFRDALLHPAVLTLITYLCGRNACLSSMQAQIKGAGGEDLVTHADNVIISSPFPPHYQFCNISMNLTEYTAEKGSICFVPGSHKLYRHPDQGEALSQRIAVSAPPGSLIVFTGNTWHGAFARKELGLRVSMLMQFVRPQLRAFEPYRENVSDELLNSLPPRFRTLMGRHLNHGWRAEGPSNDGSAYDMGNHAYD